MENFNYARSYVHLARIGHFPLEEWEEIEIQGKLINVKYKDNIVRKPSPGARGECKGFSAQSRLRLLKELNKINWEKFGMANFITLTWPDDVMPANYMERTKQRHRFLRDMEKKLRTRLTGLWRVEWKVRKTGINAGLPMPHLHLLLATNRWFDYQVVRKTWRKIIGAGDALATDVQRCPKGEIAAAYIAKYMAKHDSSPALDIPTYLNSRGREWGFIRKNMIPFEQHHVYFSPSRKVIEYLEALAKETLPWLAGQNRQSFALFGPKAIEAIRYLEELGLTRDGLAEYNT